MTLILHLVWHTIDSGWAGRAGVSIFTTFFGLSTMFSSLLLIVTTWASILASATLISFEILASLVLYLLTRFWAYARLFLACKRDISIFFNNSTTNWFSNEAPNSKSLIPEKKPYKNQNSSCNPLRGILGSNPKTETELNVRNKYKNKLYLR